MIKASDSVRTWDTAGLVAWGGRVNKLTYVWLSLTFPTNTSDRLWRNGTTIDAATGTLGGSNYVFGGTSTAVLSATCRLFQWRTATGSCSTPTMAAPTRNGDFNTLETWAIPNGCVAKFSVPYLLNNSKFLQANLNHPFANLEHLGQANMSAIKSRVITTFHCFKKWMTRNQ